MKQFKIKVNGQEYQVEVEEITEVNQAPVSTPSTATSPKKMVKEPPAKPAAEQTKAEVKPAPAQSIGEGTEIKAPMPGKVLKINVSEGDSVNEGDTVLILEAMKMENEIMADAGGKVKKISVSVNDMVETDDILLVIE